LSGKPIIRKRGRRKNSAMFEGLKINYSGNPLKPFPIGHEVESQKSAINEEGKRERLQQHLACRIGELERNWGKKGPEVPSNWWG